MASKSRRIKNILEMERAEDVGKELPPEFVSLMKSLNLKIIGVENMNTVTGILESVTKKAAKTGREYAELVVAGKKYCMFDNPDKALGLRAGETVGIDLEVNAKGFSNVKDCYVQTGTPSTVPQGDATDHKGYKRQAMPVEERASIVMQVAYKLAGDMTSKAIPQDLAWMEANWERVAKVVESLGGAMFTSIWANTAEVIKEL